MKKSIHSSEQILLQQLLKNIRQEFNLTQKEVANRLGKPQSFVSKYETGERRLDLTELRKICLAIEVELVDLVIRFEEGITK